MTKGEIRAMCDRVAVIVDARLAGTDGAKGGIASTSAALALQYLMGDPIVAILIEALDSTHQALMARIGR